MGKFWDKVKAWWAKTGLSNVVYLGGGIAAKLLLDSSLLFGAGLGIFIYVNWNVIRKLWSKSE